MTPRTNTGDQLASQLLLGNAWAPVTNTLSFINAPLEVASDIWKEWEKSPVLERNLDVKKTHHHGGLHELLETLLPLGDGTRKLFLETSNKDWTGVVSNSVGGSDLNSVLEVQYGQRQKIRSVIVTEIPHTLDKKNYEQHRGRYGVRSFTVRGPGGFVRSVRLVNEDKWVFYTTGSEPFDFENTEAYRKSRKTERFTHEMLLDYCHHLGIEPFNADFYVPNGLGILVESIVSYPVVERTLAEARAGNEDRSVPRPKRTTH
ncbi:hypothetical protein [Arthrobacter sp. ISL-95]|uniref:hypothetical protein n=1 Tax=Arthrobacter sp. ISL-95 TaxID=2819116 RepID=UPI001BE7C6FC|nr:hypothetical protein [Arthrobacter sp. ISL-95]MBT2585352.1 hypothetical protein [Arthrobacter sp. ISL-95]